MLSLRIVVCPAASACETPAELNEPVDVRKNRVRRHPKNGDSGLHARGSFPTGHLRVEDDRIGGVLLDDRDEAGIEESNLEQDQKGHRAVDLIRERVEHRRREIQAESQLDERLNGDRLAVLLADPFV